MITLINNIIDYMIISYIIGFLITFLILLIISFITYYIKKDKRKNIYEMIIYDFKISLMSWGVIILMILFFAKEKFNI